MTCNNLRSSKNKIVSKITKTIACTAFRIENTERVPGMLPCKEKTLDSIQSIHNYH